MFHLRIKIPTSGSMQRKAIQNFKLLTSQIWDSPARSNWWFLQYVWALPKVGPSNKRSLAFSCHNASSELNPLTHTLFPASKRGCFLRLYADKDRELSAIGSDKKTYQRRYRRISNFFSSSYSKNMCNAELARYYIHRGEVELRNTCANGILENKSTKYITDFWRSHNTDNKCTETKLILLHLYTIKRYASIIHSIDISNKNADSQAAMTQSVEHATPMPKIPRSSQRLRSECRNLCQLWTDRKRKNSKTVI